MNHRLDRDGVRGAVYRANADVLGSLLTGRGWPDDALQLLGDAELATQIEATSGWGATPLLRSLPVDLEELAGVLEGDPLQGVGRIDLRTGEVWPQAAWELRRGGSPEESGGVTEAPPSRHGRVPGR